MSNIYISSYTGSNSSFVIPTRVGGEWKENRITTISSNTFSHCNTLISIKGDSIKEKGEKG